MAFQDSDGIHSSLGNVVHYKRKGKNVMRLKPANYDDPKTPKQLAHREKIRVTGQFTATCKRFLNIGYQDAPVAMDNASNEARSFILNNCFDTSGVLPVLDYSKIRISRGLITPPVITHVAVEGGNMTISWAPPVKGEGTNGDDKVMVMFFTTNGEDNYAYFHQDLAVRSAGRATVRLPVSDNPVYGWMFFHNPNVAVGESRGKISDSVYLGVLRVIKWEG